MLAACCLHFSSLSAVFVLVAGALLEGFVYPVNLGRRVAGVVVTWPSGVGCGQGGGVSDSPFPQRPTQQAGQRLHHLDGNRPAGAPPLLLLPAYLIAMLQAGT